jgi:hypothetical protein
MPAIEVELNAVVQDGAEMEQIHFTLRYSRETVVGGPAIEKITLRSQTLAKGGEKPAGDRTSRRRPIHTPPTSESWSLMEARLPSDSSSCRGGLRCKTIRGCDRPPEWCVPGCCARKTISDVECRTSGVSATSVPDAPDIRNPKSFFLDRRRPVRHTV